MATKRKSAVKKGDGGTPSAPLKRRTLVRVRVVKQPVGEGGVCYLAGQEFEVTATRAKALGKLVETI